MKLKLKENPSEWRKFAWVWCAFAALVSFLLFRKQVLGVSSFRWVFGAAVAVAIIAAVFPRLFRGFYRVGMTGSFYLGQGVGKVILTIVFLLAVTPLGIMLRLAGKDLLDLKRDRANESYWKPARRIGKLDQQF